MGKNRRVSKKMSVAAGTAIYFGSVILMLVVMVVLNALAIVGCQQLAKVQGEKERELARQNDAFTRESMRWESMKTADMLEGRLLKLGMKMSLPRPDQQIRMRSDGTPVPGQRSVARIRKLRGLRVSEK